MLVVTEPNDRRVVRAARALESAHVYTVKRAHDKGQIPLRYPACDQIASRSATRSRAGRRPASEQDSVTEYGLNPSATRFELSRHVQIARTCLPQVGNQVCDQVCDLESVMEFSLKQVADQLANQLASQLAS